MLFDGDLTINATDAEIFHQMPIIITGNLSIEGNLLELPNSGVMMVFGNLYTKNLNLWESVLYVQGTLLVEQFAKFTSGDYKTQVNDIKAVFLYSNSENSIYLNKSTNVYIDKNHIYFSDIIKQLKESLLDEYYEVNDEEFEIHFNKIFKDLEMNKDIFKDDFL